MEHSGPVPPISPIPPISPEDRWTADTFGVAYREFLELKPASFKWGRLAPQGMEQVRRAVEENWSDEKLADYLQCDPAEAAACRGRFVMSRKINAPAEAGERFRRAVYEWIGEVAELDDASRKWLAADLARLVGNQIFAALGDGADVMELSRALAEGREPASGESAERPADDARPKWGPQWKD